ncbi:MAG: bacterioferritin [Curvibacter sp.]|nr:MAG: bacterioferritin [Curvibacter sp.]
MKGDAQVIGHLQAQLKNELTAINQYFLHYRMFKHWGFDKLAKKEYSESIGEMKHADMLMDRIFMLDGLPNLQDLSKILVGESVPEALECDLKAELGAQATIKAGIAHCESVRDYVSRDLLQHILDDTEEHIDFLETQIDLIAKVGLPNYLQSQLGELSSASNPVRRGPHQPTWPALQTETKRETNPIVFRLPTICRL